MPTFEILLHTSGIRVQTDGDPVPYIGFYTRRRATAQTSKEAFQRIMEKFDSDSKLLEIFEASLEHGLQPKTEIEEVWLVPWWKTILPWKTPGFHLYPADEEPNHNKSKMS